MAFQNIVKKVTTAAAFILMAGGITCFPVSAAQSGYQKISAECGEKEFTVTGVLPRGTTLSVKRCNDSAYKDAVVDLEGKEHVCDADVYDISLKDANGKEFEPGRNVNVTFTDAEENLGNGESVSVYHFEGDDADRAEKLRVRRMGEDAAIKTDSFSKFAVVKRAAVKTVTLDTGNNINNAMQALNRNATAIVFTRTAPASGVTTKDISSGGGVVAYLNGSTINIYVPATYEKASLNANSKYMFYNMSKVTRIQFNDLIDTSTVTNMSGMFSNCEQLSTLDVSEFNTANVIDMRGMFSDCSKLSTLDLSNFNNANVTDMHCMFEGCSSLTSLKITNIGISKVRDMSNMFSRCEKLSALDLSNFNTANVIIMSNMFCECSSLTSLNVKNLDTSNVTDMYNMFGGCEKLSALDLSNFNTANVITMSDMFEYCSSLTSLNVTNFDTSKVINMARMFSWCSSLTSLNIKNFDTSKVEYMSYMLPNNLRKIELGSSFVVPAATNVFTSPTTTSSGRASNGKWGLNSEHAAVTCSAADLATKGQTKGALAGTWYAQAISYTVHFNANGGTGTMADETFPYDTAKALTANTFTRTGYRFIGWNTDAHGNGTPYADQSSVKNLTNSATITLYAQWIKNSYNITYQLNGGTLSGQQTSYTIESATITLPTPTRTGYTFTGWTGSNGTTPQTSVTVAHGSYGNKTYTANWKANTNTKYTVIHQQEQLDGTYKTVETQNLTGTTDTKVTPAVKSYTGFTSPATQTVNIAGAGNTVVTYKYACNTYTITRQYRLENADGTFTGYSRIDSKKYKYGASIAAWNRAADTTYKAASIAAYTVTTKNDTLSVNVMRNTSTNNAIQYRLQNTDGSYPSTYTAAWSGTLRYGESHTWNYAQTASHQATSKAVSYNGGTVNVNVPRRTGRLVIHANGGTGDRNTTAILYGASDKINPMPSRTGYTLTGLYTAASGGTKVVNADGTMTNDGTYSASGAWKLNSDVNVYAQWTVNQYTVTCEDWFVDASNNRKVKLGSSTKQMAYGTTASGTAWGADGKDSKYHYGYVYKSATSATVGTSGATVYRYFWAWTDLNVYYAGGTTQNGATVSFKVGNGTWSDVTNEINTVQPYGTTYYLKNIRPIHEYEEFSRVENLTYDSTNGYYTYTPTYGGTSMVVYLKYKTYSLTYNLNGGSVSGNPTSYNYSTASFTLKNPTRTGYTFTGWTGSNGTTAQTSVTVAKGSYGNKSYAANWSANKYTVSFNANGGSGTTASVSATYNSNMPAIKNGMSRTGYTFTGYYDATSGGTKYYNADGSSAHVWDKAANTTLYAHWKAHNTNVTLDMQGGTQKQLADCAVSADGSTEKFPTTYDSTSYSIRNAPSRTGYTFQGYYTKPNGQGLKVYGADARAAADGTYWTSSNTWHSTDSSVTFYAYWKVNQYTVTCEDWFVDASNNRKVKLGSSTKQMNYGTTASGTAWGTDVDTHKYYNGYAYKSATSATVGTSGTTVYRYFWAWTNINIYNAEGAETCNVATFSLSSDGGKTWQTGLKNENTHNVNDVVKPYGTTYIIKDLVPVNTYEEYGSSNCTYSNGQWTYTPTTAGTDINIMMKYKTYSLTYNLNGGTVTGNPTSYNYGTANFTLKNPTKAGYTFTGWTGSNGTTAQTTVTVPKGSYGNKTYTAHFSKTITLTQKHGTSTTSQSYTLTDSEASHTFTLANTKDSFSEWTFQGWRDSATPGPKQYDPTGTITLSDSKTVYATYAQTQTLTFIDHNGTSKRTSTVTGTAYGNNSAGGVANQYPTLTAPTVGNYTGWTARGWSTGTGAADGVALASGGKISNAMTRTYYGLYQQGVTLTYAANGGTTTPAVQSGTRYFNSSGSSSNPTFTLAAALVRTGYTFTGWSVSAPISATKAAAETITPASGTALIATAQWKALTTKVTLDMQGGKQTATGDSTVSADGSTESFTCTYDGTSYRYRTQIPTRTGYTFQGYFSKPDGAGEQVYTKDGLAMTGSFWSSQIWKYTGSSVTFYACWSANPYTIHFDANTGTGTMKDQILTYNQNGTLSANTFTKKGYSFTGWTTNADGTGKKFADRDVVSNLVTSGSITLYAQWQKNPYTVTVPKKVQYQNMNAGTVDHTVSIPITVSGDFPGTVSVTSKPDTLTAPDGKTLNMETNSHKNAITFTAGDGTKNDALTITGTARLDKYSGIVQYSVSQTE